MATKLKADLDFHQEIHNQSYRQNLVQCSVFGDTYIGYNRKVFHKKAFSSSILDLEIDGYMLEGVTGAKLVSSKQVEWQTK